LGAEVSQLALDVATYVGAVAAGVSVNGLSVGAKALVHRVKERLGLSSAQEPTLLTVTLELVQAIGLPPSAWRLVVSS
jgi:hypothetical protein